MNYEKNYFYDISRYAPFSYLYPFSKKSKFLEHLILEVIKKKEMRFAGKRLKTIMQLGAKSSLDVGCASGELVDLLIRNKVDAYGVDVSRFQVEKLSKEFKGRFYLASARSLPFDSGKFDVVSSYHTLEHIPIKDIAVSLIEMARVSNHYLIFEFPAKESFNASIDPTHITILSSDEWVDIFKKKFKEWKTVELIRANYFRPFKIILQKVK
jgi:SAM-dependent methyltransferase